jgi:hypothetical protein
MDQPQEAQALGSNLHISFETELKAAWGIIYYTHIVFPITEVSTWKVLKVKRIIGTINQMPFRLALQSDGECGLYLMIGKELCKKANIEIGQQVQVYIEQDLDPDRIDFAEEFLEVLAQDPDAQEKFFAFTLGKQRSLNIYITQVKSVNSRLKRSFELADKIKRNALSGG